MNNQLQTHDESHLASSSGGFETTRAEVPVLIDH